MVPTYSFWRSDRIGLLPVIKAYHHPELFLPYREKDKVSLERAYRGTYDVLRGSLDTTQVEIGEERYDFILPGDY